MTMMAWQQAFCSAQEGRLFKVYGYIPVTVQGCCARADLAMHKTAYISGRKLALHSSAERGTVNGLIVRVE